MSAGDAMHGPFSSVGAAERYAVEAIAKSRVVACDIVVEPLERTIARLTSSIAITADRDAAIESARALAVWVDEGRGVHGSPLRQVLEAIMGTRIDDGRLVRDVIVSVDETEDGRHALLRLPREVDDRAVAASAIVSALVKAGHPASATDYGRAVSVVI